MNWQDVQVLRKAGRLEEAAKVALKILDEDPQDFRTKSQYEWVIYGYIRDIVARIARAQESNQAISPSDVEGLMGWMRKYYECAPQVPGMACSNIVGKLAKVGAHLPKLPDIIDWIGMEGLRREDWQPNSYKGKAYPSLALKIARALCRWVKSYPDASNEKVDLALEWAERVSATAQGDDVLWLNWDMAILLRQKGDFRRAAEILAGVIKAKRNEFWVWAEAGRLYSSEQPDLALACFCRALECPADPKFLVKAHRELAELLAEREEFAQASREVATAINIRQAEGWGLDRNLEGLISQSWYDASAAGAEDSKTFYAKHSQLALTLCFDVVETRAASYLGLLEPRKPKEPPPNWKPRPLPRFAVKDGNNHSWSLVGRGMKNLKCEPGAPLTVVIGRQDGIDQQTIVHVSARKDGGQWDCLESGIGIVTREATSDRAMRVLVVDTGDELDVHRAPERCLKVGDGAQLGLARNPKNNRVEVFDVEPGELPPRRTRRIQGQLRRNPKGFAFVDDAFVPPSIVESIRPDANEVVAMAVYAKRRDKGEWGWRVVKLDSA